MSTLVVVALGLLAQVNAPALHEALRAVEDGSDASFGADVGAHAVAVVRARGRAMAPTDLDRHLEVALRGSAHEALAPVVGRLLEQDGPALEPALRAAAALPPRACARVVAAMRTRAAQPQISALCTAEDERVARGAIHVVFAAGRPPELSEHLRRLLRQGLEARARWALEALAAREPSRELLDELLGVEPDLSPSVHEAFARAVCAFLDARPRLAPVVVEGLRRRSSPALLGAMKAMPPDQWEAATAEVMGIVTGLSADLAVLLPAERDLLAAAIGAAADLRAVELLAHLPSLCSPGIHVTIRVAALRAVGALGARETGTIDLLLRHLEESGPVGDAAFAGLRLRAGARLPLRPLVWRSWRERTRLPTMTPEEHRARLVAERASRHAARTSAPRLDLGS